MRFGTAQVNSTYQLEALHRGGKAIDAIHIQSIRNKLTRIYS